MDNEQHKRLIKALYHIEESVQKTKTKLSWWPFWIVGYLFTLGYNWAEVGEILAKGAWWDDIVNVALWFFLWPWCLGYTINQ